MPVLQPETNEYQRALLRPATQSSVQTEDYPPPPKRYRNLFSDLPPYGQTAITEWGACLYGKTGDIKAKSWSGLVTYYSRYPILDWDWLQRQPREGWEFCPSCGRTMPLIARYWWRDGKYFRKDACRDCKCSTTRRWGPRKRNRAHSTNMS